MKLSDQERLLHEVLADEALETIRAKSLARGVAELKTRRRIRALASGVAAAVVVIGTITFSRWPQESRRTAEALPSPVSPHAIKVINDEELLALFPTRSLALVGAAGRQELIFLDEPESRPAREK